MNSRRGRAVLRLRLYSWPLLKLPNRQKLYLVRLSLRLLSFRPTSPQQVALLSLVVVARLSPQDQSRRHHYHYTSHLKHTKTLYSIVCLLVTTVKMASPTSNFSIFTSSSCLRTGACPATQFRTLCTASTSRKTHRSRASSKPCSNQSAAPTRMSKV